MPSKRFHRANLIIILLLSSLATITQAERLSYIGDITTDASYIDTDNDEFSALRTLALIGVDIDLTGWAPHSANIHVSYAAFRGDNSSAQAGVSQALSNIDDSDHSRWFEAYLWAQPIAALTIKIGQMDANADFATPQNGTDFINASMGINLTILGVPAYPLATIGIYSLYQINSDFSIGVGVYDSSENHQNISAFHKAP